MTALPLSLEIPTPGQPGKEAALGDLLPSSSQSESLPIKGDSVVGEKAEGGGRKSGRYKGFGFLPILNVLF